MFGSIAASVFGSRMAGLAHGTIGSVGTAAEVAHHVGGSYGAALLHTAASAFVTGADRAVIAGAIATLAGLVVAVGTLRAPRRNPAQAPEPAAVVAQASQPAAVTAHAQPAAVTRPAEIGIPGGEVLVPAGAPRG